MTAAVFKRKIHHLNDEQSCDNFMPKKCKSFIVQPIFYKDLIVQKVKLLMGHIFSAPFVKRGGSFQEPGGSIFFDDVLQKIQGDKYEDIFSIFSDLRKALDDTERRRDEDLRVYDLYFCKEDIPVMANEMRKKIQFLESDLCQDEIERASTEVIKRRSSYIDLGRDEIKIHQEQVKKFKEYTFYPSRKHDFKVDKVAHSYIAGYQFHKMIGKNPNAPVTLRKILNTSDAIHSIKYIENPEISAAYEQQKEIFRKQGKVDESGKVEELLLFHGTTSTNLDSILASNFSVDATPRQLNTKLETRKKTMLFGKGIYFSEYPAISLMYGNGLLLCKVLPGNCEVFRPQGIAPEDLSDEHDSREIRSNDKQGVIHVVNKPSQIMPYCVINIKRECITADFTKPSCTLAPTANNNGQEGWTKIVPDRIEEQATTEKTLAQFTEPCEKVEDQSSVCSICLELLSDSKSVSLTICGHTFHTSCVSQLVSAQARQSYIRCPECTKIHGVKTGNQPKEGGEMMYKRLDKKLPGHQDCGGTIVIKYSFNDGIQTEDHPHPGKPFFAKGFPRLAFLPDNQKGNRVLKLLVKAFLRGLTFTVGLSMTRGEDDCVIWNGIHHKTSINDGGNGHGYPDAGYLDRVTKELSEHGIED